MLKVTLRGWGAKLSDRAHCLDKPWLRLQHCKHTHWGLRLLNDFLRVIVYLVFRTLMKMEALEFEFNTQCPQTHC